MKTKPIWKPGDAVTLGSPRRREYGRVIATYWDAKQQWWDCWVAFFGFKWPTEKQLKFTKPYVLRYLEGSLTAYKPKPKRKR